MSFISVNGKIMPADAPALLAGNRSYRYGDGLFETMKLRNGKILLAPLHFERLFAGLSLLKFEVPGFFTMEKLQQELLQLGRKNASEKLARLRLSVSRGNGGLYDEEGGLQYIMECWPVNESLNELNGNGLVIGIYPVRRKNSDAFANLKSANFLPYIMAALYARENKWNDCLVLNNSGNITDSTIANVFMLKDGVILTPALDQGCVAGVMRRWLVEKLQGAGYKVQECQLTINDLETADEIFLTNAMNGLRWVGRFGNKIYSNTQAKDIYNRFVRTIQG